jgi:polyhydroxyalkanoate synthesis repressor PhaR
LALVKANVAVHNGAVPPTLVVKKYPNRRLYDTVESRYITLEDLAGRIKGGSDVLVQDATTGIDLTQVTLTQIILESRGGAKLLPVPLLLRLIRLGDEHLAEFFGRYISWALELYVQARHGARALKPLNPLAAAPFAATDALARLVLGATQWAKPGSGPAAPPPMPIPFPDGSLFTDEAPEAEPSAPHMPTGAEVAAAIEAETAQVHGHVVDVADDVARLRRELEDLKRSMTAPARATRAPRLARPGRKALPKKR